MEYKKAEINNHSFSSLPEQLNRHFYTMGNLCSMIFSRDERELTEENQPLIVEPRHIVAR